MSTYGLPAEITAQTLFDKAAAHLFTQGHPSFLPDEDGNPTIACAYRGVGNTACAVGCLIADDRYSREFENKSIDGDALLRAMPELEPHREMLRKVQYVHDIYTKRDDEEGYDRASLATQLRLITKEFGLTDDVIDVHAEV